MLKILGDITRKRSIMPSLHKTLITILALMLAIGGSLWVRASLAGKDDVSVQDRHVLPDQAAHNVTWKPESLDLTLSPGESVDVPVIAHFSGSSRGVEPAIDPTLQPYLTVTPSSNTEDDKHSAAFNMHVSIPSDALYQAISGDVRLNYNKATSSRALPISIEVLWPRVSNLPSGMSFNYPTFGLSSEYEITSANDGSVSIRVLHSESNAQAVVQYIVGLIPNPGHLTLAQWFSQNVDLSGSILSGGGFQLTTLANGVQVLLITGQLPPSHLDCCGPVKDVYALSPSGDVVITIVTGHEHNFGDIGDPQTIQSLYVGLLESLAE